MGWDIPELPSAQKIKHPSYLLWVIALALIMALGFVITLFLYQDNSSSLFWLYAVYLPFALWFVLFSCRNVYHYYSLTKNDEISEYQQYVTKNWQDWAKVQIPIFGQHIICAEQDGLQALTRDSLKIPLYPQKARPLFNQTASVKPYWFLDEVMSNLAQQCADYRKYLTHIYLPNCLMDDDDLVDAIFACWDLKPEPIYDYEVFMAKLYENPESIELSLLLVCQYDDSTYHDYSKFISAMLLGSESLINKAGLAAKAWLGRSMTLDEANLSADIEQFFSYTQVPPNKIKDIWISGLNQLTRSSLTKICYEYNVGGKSGICFHDIDLTFARPSPLTHYFVLAIASYGVGTYFREQLTVIGNQGKIDVQLISPKKLASS